MNKKLSVLVAIVAMLALAFSGCAQQAPAPAPAPTQQPVEQTTVKTTEYVNDDLLLDADWLNSSLEKGIVIIDTRDEKSYQAGHIKGAINTAWQPFTDMNAKKPGDKGWGTLLPADQLSAVIAAMGIDETKIIVVYGDSPAGWGTDGRVAWTLKMAGLKYVKILNGGWAAWEAKGYAADKAAAAPTATSFKISAMNEELNTTTEYITANIDKLKIIDTRETDEFEGAVKYGEARGGHLPNAINIKWTEVFNADGTIKNQADIDTLMSSKGISKSDEIVTYCTKGIRSAHMALILRMAGYNAKNYDASFYEWSGNKELPLAAK